MAKSEPKTKAAPEKKTSEKATPEKPKQTQAKFDKVDNGHYVHVEYVGTLDNGEEFDNSKNHGPIKFVAGAGQVIKGFDEAVMGMKVDQSKKFKIEKQNAYGDINPQLVHEVPVDKLPPDVRTKVKVGGFLMLQGPGGQQMPAKVTKVTDKTITLDMNHPLAGKNLTFNIKVVKIEEAPAGCDCGDECGHGCGDGCDCH